MKGREGGEMDAGGGGGLVEQNAKERGGSESCFVFTSWLIGPLISFSFFYLSRSDS